MKLEDFKKAEIPVGIIEDIKSKIAEIEKIERDIKKINKFYLFDSEYGKRKALGSTVSNPICLDYSDLGKKLIYIPKELIPGILHTIKCFYIKKSEKAEGDLANIWC